MGSRMITKFGGRAPGGLSGSYSNRLKAAIDESSEASQIEIVERRKQFCFATRYKGVWGKPWPDFNHNEFVSQMTLAQYDQNETVDSEEDGFSNVSSSSNLCNDSLIADSFNLSLGKVE